MKKKNKKSIIVFLNAFWNNGKGMSGGDQMLIQIFKRIRNSFDIVDCYTSPDGKWEIAKEVCGVTFHTSSRFFDQFPLGVNYILRTAQSFGVLFSRRVDIVYGGSDFFPDVIPLFLYKIFHPKTRWVQCVFHIYTDWKKRPGNKIKNLVAQYFQEVSLVLIKKADTVININCQVREELIKKGFDKNKIIVNTPGINIKYLEELKVTDNTLKYDGTFLARLNPSKGIFDLVKIWKGVVKQLPNAKLAIMGGGSEEMKRKIKKEIKKESLEKNIDVMGFLENDESFSIIKNSRVFIFPSHEEGFGIVIAEAMICGVPVISWNLPVYQEIFEDNCIQIEENDIELFVKKTLDLMEENNLREGLVNKARIFINKYSWDLIGKKHLKILTNKK